MRLSPFLFCRPAETVLPVGRALLTHPTKFGFLVATLARAWEFSTFSHRLATVATVLSGASLLPVYPFVTGKRARPTGPTCPYCGTTDSSRIRHRRVSVTAWGSEGKAIYRDDADR